MTTMGITKDYDHNYSSCSKTFATFCIYHNDLIPNDITARLNIEPSSSHKKGDISTTRKGHIMPIGNWCLTTKYIITSQDVRYHIDALLAQIKDKKSTIKLLQDNGYDMCISCFWVSSSGNGGPTIDHRTMSELGELCIDVDFDIWFDIIPLVRSKRSRHSKR